MPLLDALDRFLGISTRISADSYTTEFLSELVSRSRASSDWIMSTSRASANQKVYRSLSRLKSASRQLVDSTWFASAFVDLLADNVIGAEGIRLQAQNKEADGKTPRSDVNQEIERGWREWSENANCTASRTMSLPEVEALTVQTVPQDGEALIRMLPGFGNRFGFALQSLDTDQLDVAFSRPATDTENAVVMGIEIDKWGGPVAYHILDTHPAEPGGKAKKRDRIPANQILQPFITRRAGQMRGLPWFAVILTDAENLDGYTEAEIVAARSAASKMGFLTVDPELYPDPDSVIGKASRVKMSARPGEIETLPAGYTFSSWDPQHPNAAYADFVKAILRGVSGGLNVSYNTLANDLEGVNYSSLRQGALRDRDVYRRLQGWIVGQYHRRVFRAWLPQAILSGQLSLPTRRAADWDRHSWGPRGWSWVDPLKEVQADILATKALMKSRTEALSARGRDLEEVFAEIQEEQILAEMYGLDSLLDAGLGAGPEKKGTAKDDEDGTDEDDAAGNGRAEALRHAGGNGRGDPRGARGNGPRIPSGGRDPGRGAGGAAGRF